MSLMFNSNILPLGGWVPVGRHAWKGRGHE